VGFTSAILLEEFLLLKPLPFFLLIFHVIVICIWTIRNKMTSLATLIADPLALWLVVLVLLGPQDLSKGFNDEGHFLNIKFRNINCFFLTWGLLLLNC
jgi:hypothetical protein